jgi:4-diphosphocytidyl-2-C-methyl-D-erythritol kinase
MPTVRVEALAKVNLGLYVLYRRRDGYHELRTVFQTVSLGDRIRLDYRRRGGPAVELTCNRPELAAPGNLASRAAVRLLETTADAGRASIHLEKRIPVGAGLGGGSSDAAAVLRALGHLLRPRPDEATLLRLASELGSDVPFFLLGGRAVGLGRGTEIYPLPDAPPLWMVLVAPPWGVSTAEAYRRLGAHLTSRGGDDKIFRLCSRVCVLEQGSAGASVAVLENDFEAAVFRMHPELKRLKARLMDLGASPALLCGSGSALFGVFQDRRQALRARDSLDLEEGSCFVVSTVTRASYRARWRRWLTPADSAR